MADTAQQGPWMKYRNLKPTEDKPPKVPITEEAPWKKYAPQPRVLSAVTGTATGAFKGAKEAATSQNPFKLTDEQAKSVAELPDNRLLKSAAMVPFQLNNLMGYGTNIAAQTVSGALGGAVAGYGGANPAEARNIQGQAERTVGGVLESEMGRAGEPHGSSAPWEKFKLKEDSKPVESSAPRHIEPIPRTDWKPDEKPWEKYKPKGVQVEAVDVQKNTGAPVPEGSFQYRADDPNRKLIGSTAIKDSEMGEKPPQGGSTAGAQAVPTSDILKRTIAQREAAEAAKPVSNVLMGKAKEAAKTIQAIISPQSMEGGKEAAASIRRAVGFETQRAERSAAAFEDLHAQVNRMSLDEKLDLVDWIQTPKRTSFGPTGYGAPKEYSAPKELQPLLQTVKDTMERYRRELEGLSATEQMNFVDNYLKQTWKDPQKAEQFFGGGKEGSKAFTKKRVYDNYVQGIREGHLEPVTLDPIEITLKYVDNAARFIASEKVMDTAKDQGTVKYFTPGKAPEGWAEVGGRNHTKTGPEGVQYAYAPEGWARVYNNYTSKGVQGPWGDMLRTVQKGFNAITGMKLALSGYHAAMMTQEAVVNSLGDAFNQLARGNIKGAARSALESPIKPILSWRKGRQMQRAYLGLETASPKLQRIIDSGVEANYRFSGKGKVADEYRFSGAGNYVNAWKKGVLKSEMLSDLKDLKNRPLIGGIKAAAKHIGRAMETISSPLFEHYIPALKNGAFADTLGRWLEDHPNASHEECIAKAREVSDMVDERFGEMNHDNIFWSKTQKQAAQMALISFSYELGTAKTLGGGAWDIASAPYRAVQAMRGKAGDKPIWTDRMGYTVALPIVYATLNAITQYLYTGKGPEDVQDTLAARTGGTDPRTGQPERVQWPSYMKDVFAWSKDPLGEAANKLNPGVQLVKAMVTNSDWRGDPLTSSTDTYMQGLKKYLEFVGEGITPISFGNKTVPGSHIGGVARFMGAKPATMRFVDPKGYEKMETSIGLDKAATKAWHDHTAEELAAGRSVDYRKKHTFIQQYKKAHE